MPIGHGPSAVRLPMLEVLGSDACEDTAIVRSRLDALGVAHRYLDIDVDADALARVRTLNGGHRVTPTVIAGDRVAAEPSLERLGELLATLGVTDGVAAPTQLHGDVTAWPLPHRVRTTDAGVPFDLGSLRGRRQTCLFLAHGVDCQACFGYARQLGGAREALEAADGTLVTVLVDAPEALGSWRHGLPADHVLLADPDGAWHAAAAARLGIGPTAASLVLLDRFLAPRVVGSAPEAGGLPDPSSMVAWLDFLALECPECSGELPWPAAAGASDDG